VYGTLYTVRLSFTMTSMLLARAGVSEGKARQTEESFGGSTRTWHFEREGRSGLGARGSVMAGPTCPSYVLARSGSPRGSAFRSSEPRLERFPVCELGVTAGPGQGSLRAEPPGFGNQPVPALVAAQRHPGRRPRSVNVSEGDPDCRGRSLRIRSLTREGDVGPTRDPGRAEDGDLPATRWELEDKDPPTIHPLRTEGDVQGDVDHSCCSRMFSPNTAAYRPRSPGVTSS
jgi:hypothetical protein